MTLGTDQTAKLAELTDEQREHLLARIRTRNAAIRRNYILGALAGLVEQWGGAAVLRTLPDAEFKPGCASVLELALELAGLEGSPRAIVEANGWLDLTIKDFASEVVGAFDARCDEEALTEGN